jgi:HlyD family secretion protein
MRHRLAIISFAVGLPVIAVVGVYARRDHVAPEVVTVAATRGDVVSAIAATGTVEAVTTVEVGSQVSGTIQSLGADFNSIVRKGQVLARLDPALVQSGIEQARANVLRASADADRLRVTVADDERKLARAQDLSARQLIPATDLEDAVVATQSSEAQLRSQEAAASQARASLKQAEVNLEKTVILSPIDGIVVARSVDIGQTVAASLSAPTLFVIAANMTEMQVMASIDESDVGRIASGQAVSFTVDAYPRDTFHGRVEQVRLNPDVSSNVVTYTAVVSAPNPQLKLKPGMTANITIEVARRNGVLRVPAAALQFHPSADVMKAFAVSAGTPVTAEKDSRGRTVWQLVAGTLRPIAVTPGTSDGAFTEVLDGPLAEGALVVTRASLTGDTASAARPANSASPLMGPQPPRR